MSKAAKNILSLNHDEAMDFFMKSEQYHGFELPEYFSFDEVLKYVREKVGTTPYEECLQKGVSPEYLSDVNLDILLNKDGRYAVRPIILANPFLYYFLVREVCCESNWQVIKDLFEKFNVPHITSCAIPIIPNEKEPFHKATTINNWWNSMEQRSIELSLEYRYMFVTDITNCYGSVNPQTFDWAFTLKDTTIATSIQSPIAQNIQKFLRALQQGRNIGIPQGSAIFDFVGEIILGYSDLLLHESLQAKAKEYEGQGKAFPDYEIIRYRDDYRSGLDRIEVLDMMHSYLEKCLIPIDIYEYDPAAPDELYNKFQERWILMSQLDKKNIGIRANQISTIDNALNDPKICSMTALSEYDGIGILTLQKCFNLIIDYHPQPKLDL